MRYKVLSILFVFCLWPMQSAAVTRDTFLVRTTQELVDLCTAPENDPLHGAAIGGAAGLAGGYIYDSHKRSQQQAYEQGYREGSRR